MMPSESPRSPYEEAIDFLFSRTNYEQFRVIPYAQMADSLARLKEANRFLGEPDRAFHLIHVAGTKGKGSVSTMLERILRSSGYRTGLFTSPHLHLIEERFAINGKSCSSEVLAQVLLDLRDRLKRFSPSGTEWTFFELSTLAAFLLFQRQGVEWAILETGLGGRFDATNICVPEMTVITSIAYDHCEILGTTLEEIAGEKAGIIKSGVPVVSAVAAGMSFTEDSEAIVSDCFRATQLRREDLKRAVDRIARIARSKEAPLIEITGDEPEMAQIPPLDLPGKHQRINALVAFSALVQLQRRGKLRLDYFAALEALARTTLPAHFESISRQPDIVIDGAHNRQSAAALAQVIREKIPHKKRTLLFASSAGKDVGGMFCELFPLFDRVLLGPYSGPRALSSSELFVTANEVLRSSSVQPEMVCFDTFSDFSNGIAKLLGDPREQDTFFCACGSFYFAAAIGERFSQNREIR